LVVYDELRCEESMCEVDFLNGSICVVGHEFFGNGRSNIEWWNLFPDNGLRWGVY
jgi:hypothetical protein